MGNAPTSKKGDPTENGEHFQNDQLAAQLTVLVPDFWLKLDFC